MSCVLCWEGKINNICAVKWQDYKIRKIKENFLAKFNEIGFDFVTQTATEMTKRKFHNTNNHEKKG